MRRQNALISCTGTQLFPGSSSSTTEQGAYLQMGDQLDLDIGSHGELLDSYTGSALEQDH